MFILLVITVVCCLQRRRRRRAQTVEGAIIELNTMASRSEEHTSELQSLTNLVCRLLLEKKKKKTPTHTTKITFYALLWADMTIGTMCSPHEH